jgi:hypothetical protein
MAKQAETEIGRLVRTLDDMGILAYCEASITEIRKVLEEYNG